MMLLFERLRAYVDLLAKRDAEIADLQRAALAANRASLDLAVAWSVSLERPEIDIREDLDILIANLSDRVAKIEEHVV
jgi:hypothetical protein